MHAGVSLNPKKTLYCFRLVKSSGEEPLPSTGTVDTNTGVSKSVSEMIAIASLRITQSCPLVTPSVALPRPVVSAAAGKKGGGTLTAKSSPRRLGGVVESMGDMGDERFFIVQCTSIVILLCCSLPPCCEVTFLMREGHDVRMHGYKNYWCVVVDRTAAECLMMRVLLIHFCISGVVFCQRS
jgi:hypothetical protein